MFQKALITLLVAWTWSMFDTSRFDQALNEAIQYMDTFEGLEPRSALKQAASDNQIAEGEQLQQFVRWAESKLYE